MRVCLDLDMTLNDMAYVWCEHLGIVPSDIKYFGWVRDYLGIHADSWWAQSHVYDLIKPLPGAVEFVQALQQVGEVVIITHTLGAQTTFMKEDWIQKYFGKIETIHTGEKYVYTRDSILMDDHPRHVYDHMRQNPGSIGILFNHKVDYGWANPHCLANVSPYWSHDFKVAYTIITGATY